MSCNTLNKNIKIKIKSFWPDINYTEKLNKANKYFFKLKTNIMQLITA